MVETTRKPLSWFKVSPQIREDLGSESELRNLGESLRTRQLYAVGATADGELIYGFRRFRAASLVGMADLAVAIYTERLTTSEISCIRLTENIHRLDMNPFEKWRSCEELRTINPQWDTKAIAQHLSLDPSAVTKWLSPSKCIKPWQDALKAGSVGITDCYVASQASEAEQARLLTLKLGGASRDQLQRDMRRTKPMVNASVIRSSRITVALVGGTKIVISGQNLSLLDVIERLSECLDAARKGLKDRLDPKTWQQVMKDKAQAMDGVTADV